MNKWGEILEIPASHLLLTGVYMRKSKGQENGKFSRPLLLSAIITDS